MATEFKLPSLGENIESGDIVKILVSVGEQVTKQQPILELETDKAVIEVPSSIAGSVKTIHVQEGEKTQVGQLILTFDAVPTPQSAGEGEVSRTGVLPAGKTETQKERGDVSEPPSGGDSRRERVPQELEARRPTKGAVVTFSPSPSETPSTHPGRAAAAAPSVRRFAREIGIDIHEIQGSGRKGRISLADVKAHARRLNASRTDLADSPSPLDDFSEWGAVERRPLRGVRRKTAEHLSAAWSTIPHVTQLDRADITELDKARKRHANRAQSAGGKLTITAIVLKVVAAALKVFPQFNASLDKANSEIVYKKYYHVGIAVDTDRGLLVPVVRDVDQKNILQLSVELSGIANRARNGKLTLEDMRGGCFTISNLGGIGGTHFTPVVNAPEVAILGISQATREPVYREGKLQARLLLPLSLSYDHRVIDGADGIRFLRWLSEALESPFLTSLEG